jgi:hypothetical protein
VGARPGPRRGGRTAGTGRWRGWRPPGRTPRRRDDEQRREAVHVQTVRVQIVGRGPARQPLVRDPLQRSPFSERDRIAVAVERSTASGATPAGNACRTQQESSFISRKFNTMFTMSYTGWIRLLRMNQMLQGQLRL